MVTIHLPADLLLQLIALSLAVLATNRKKK